MDSKPPMDLIPQNIPQIIPSSTSLQVTKKRKPKFPGLKAPIQEAFVEKIDRQKEGSDLFFKGFPTGINKSTRDALAVFLVFLSPASFFLIKNAMAGRVPGSSGGLIMNLVIQFGLTLYMIPLVLPMIGLQLFYRHRIQFEKSNYVGLGVVYLAVAGLLGNEGGKWGGGLNYLFSSYFGTVPAQFLFFGLFFSGLILFFNTIYREMGWFTLLFLKTSLTWLVKGGTFLSFHLLRGIKMVAHYLYNLQLETIISEQQNRIETTGKSLEETSENTLLYGSFSTSSSKSSSGDNQGAQGILKDEKPGEPPDSAIVLKGGSPYPNLFINEIPKEEMKGDTPQENVEILTPHLEKTIKSANPLPIEMIHYRIPGIELLSYLDHGVLEEIRKTNETYILEKKETLLQCFSDFKIGVEISAVTVGSSIIRYEVRPDKGTPVKNIVARKNDIALYLATESVRIEAPVSGKDVVGVEIPLKKSYPVLFSELINDKKFQRNPSPLFIALGKNIAGENVYADLSSMPHLLIAGQTGAGKSVCMNTIITSILYRSTPEQVRFIMIDPKVVELSIYNPLPHLLAPVVTDATEAPAVLMWAVEEMERRYLHLEKFQARHILSYNQKVKENQAQDPESPLETLPYIVILIDELNDLMMVARKEIEASIIRIAQKARAVGIHLVVATQRPSKDVITGVLKGNLPSRIAFQVASWIDSKTILDRAGAEVLLGKGDMLYTPVGKPKPVRIQGCFISDEECLKIISYFENQSFVQDFVDLRPKEMMESDGDEKIDISEIDPKIFEILEHISLEMEVSVSSIQRRFAIGYNRAARIVEKLDQLGLMAPATSGVKKRKVTEKINAYVTVPGDNFS